MGQTMPFFNPDTTTPVCGVAPTTVDPSVTRAAQETLMSAQLDALHGAPWIARAQADDSRFLPIADRMGDAVLRNPNDDFLRAFAFQQ